MLSHPLLLAPGYLLHSERPGCLLRSERADIELGAEPVILESARQAAPDLFVLRIKPPCYW